jgi:hypothetical protein
MKPDFKSSPLSDTITENLDGLLSASPRRATGALARQRLMTQIQEINDLEREAIKIEYEIFNRIKAGGGAPKEAARRSRRSTPSTRSTTTTASTGKTSSATTTTRSPASAKRNSDLPRRVSARPLRELRVFKRPGPTVPAKQR